MPLHSNPVEANKEANKEQANGVEQPTAEANKEANNSDTSRMNFEGLESIKNFLKSTMTFLKEHGSNLLTSLSTMASSFYSAIIGMKDSLPSFPRFYGTTTSQDLKGKDEAPNSNHTNGTGNDKQLQQDTGNTNTNTNTGPSI